MEKTGKTNLAKKGLLLCMITVMSFSMMACGGGKGKKSGAADTGTKTESQQSTEKTESKAESKQAETTDSKK